MNRECPDGWARPADGWARAAAGHAASAEERLVIGVVALGAREVSLGADRRNLRGSPSAVASGRVGGDDKEIATLVRRV